MHLKVFETEEERTLFSAVLWSMSFAENENRAENVKENKHSLHLNIFHEPKICQEMHYYLIGRWRVW